MFLVELSSGLNWYDALWVLALLYGLWDGIRTGFLGEIARLVGWILMITLGLKFYIPVGNFFKQEIGMSEEFGRLVAFILLVLLGYFISMLIRKMIQQWTKKSTGTPILQNLGGGLAGLLRMALVMVFLTIWLSLTTSPTLHQQVAKNSQFGRMVVQSIPSVEAVAKRPYVEHFLLFTDIKRAAEVSDDDMDKTNKPGSKPKAH